MTKDSGWIDKTETSASGTKSNVALSVHSESENTVKLVHKGKFSAPMRDSKPLAEADGQAGWNDRTKPDYGACRQGARSQPEVKVANKGISKLLTAECIQNWSETFVVDNGRRDFHSAILLVDNKEVLEEEIHLVLSEHSIVQTEVNLNYTMTETRKEYRSLAFASRKQTLDESTVPFELLQESAEVITVQQDVQQGTLFQVTVFYAGTLLLEERNKRSELDKSFGFVNEQQFALQDNWTEGAMY